MVSILAALVFTATAIAGNPHGTPPGHEKEAASVSVAASAHVKADATTAAHAQATASGKAHTQSHATAKAHGSGGAAAGANTAAGVHGKSSTHAGTGAGVTTHTSSHANASVKAGLNARGHSTTHAGTQTTASASSQVGVKSSAKTAFNSSVSASSNQTKLYGNGMTAGQIVVDLGLGNAMLFGPGNSQAHMVLCGGRMIDVHAAKAHVAACAATGLGGTTAMTSPTGAGGATTAHGSVGTNASAGLTTGATATPTPSNSGGGGVLGATTRTGNLPFTGLVVGVPIGLALMLLVSGLAMRRAARSMR